uniref:Uncharacterized protein n=1 Tax=Equus caballus TaxID=9796 RepID=A0A3Q2GVI7_HORSE
FLHFPAEKGEAEDPGMSLVCSERNKGSSALGGGQAVAECGSREGSGQRMSCQPIAARLLVAGMGKSPPGRGP